MRDEPGVCVVPATSSVQHDGDVARYVTGWRCEAHSPWALHGRPRPPTPDPALTLEGLRAAAAAASMPVDPRAVERQHLIDTGIAGRRGTPPPTRAQTEAKVRAANADRLRQAQAARDTAMAVVDRAAQEEWKDQCRRALWHLAKTRENFTTDDVWDRLAEMGVDTIGEPRALGPVVMRALRAGAIRDTGRMARSRRRHATKITIYERNPHDE